MGNDLKTGKVYLVGAGCGDPKLLTVKARELLAVCESVIYDSLVSEEMLQWTKPGTSSGHISRRCPNRYEGGQSRTVRNSMWVSGLALMP